MTRGSKENTSDAGGTSKAYVDTHYLLSIIFGEDDAGAARHLLYTLRDNSYHILVLQTVLGEVTAKILEKSRADELPDRLRIYHSILLDCGIDHFCLPGVDRRAPRYMLDLQGIDDHLDPNDALIISQVLADPDSKFFFTADAEMRRNSAILDYESKLREEGDRNTRLKIRESLD